ncbi:MAG: DEAD/DEAH box helicase [Deltaproteobacteria bacterium]|nr:DEAD/DEAH box helicase [Deltaproteobacteria bacterium]
MIETAASPAAPAPVHSISGEPAAFPFVPRLRVYAERVAVDRGDLRRSRFEDVTLPVLALTFDYGGGRRFRATAPTVEQDDDLYEFDDDASTARARPVPFCDPIRNTSAEANAQRLLENFGAVELSRLEDVVPDLASLADYAIHPDGDVHSVCSFLAHAVPRLRERGFDVLVDESCPFRVVKPAEGWYATARDDSDSPDWFSLELGVDVDGERVDLVPALVALIEAAPVDSTLRALERVPARYRALDLGDGRFLPIDPERLLGILRVLVELYDGVDASSGTLRLHRESAHHLDELDSAVGEERPIRWSAGRDLASRARSVRERPAAEQGEVARGLQATLRPYQLEGLAWLQHLRRHEVGGILADDMGLGKTLQTIAHLAAEHESGRMDLPSLVVVPTSLVGNWERELRRFAPSLRVRVLHGRARPRGPEAFAGADVVVTTYPVLVRDVEELSGSPLHLLILDEAQAIKNPSSRAHQAAATLEARHRLCLTGTPVENNLGELHALFDFLSPGLLGSAEQFRTRFRHPIERDGNEQQLAALRQRVAPFVIRRTKEEVAKDLPPKTELVRPVEIQGAERELYESIRVAAHAEVRGIIRKKGFVGSTVAILDALMKLRQACCHPRLVAMEQARDVDGSAKFELLLSMLDSQLREGRRVLVFSQFARLLALASEELLRRGTRHVMLTGQTRDRQATVDAFQGGKADVFLISLKAGGTGLNLTRADTVIHYEPWWNPAAQSQATDRAYRIGQQNPVFVHNLIVSGSVEERMLRLQEQKRHLADSILGRGGPTARLSEEDIDDLFAPMDDL